MSKKQTTEGKTATSEILKDIGPFEKAKTNLQKFSWNLMICYTTDIAIRSLAEVKDLDTPEAQITRITAEVTLKGLAQLILERDGGQWN